jgi:hypothetical protein
MTTKAITLSGPVGRTASHTYDTATVFFLRCRYVIEYSDWDEVLLAWEPLMNRICIGIIIAAVLYFLPSVFMAILLR